MKSPVPKISGPQLDFETHLGKCLWVGHVHGAMCIPLDGGLAMVASPAWGSPSAQAAETWQGKPGTKPTPDVQFGMNQTPHFQLPACVLCKGDNESSV